MHLGFDTTYLHGLSAHREAPSTHHVRNSRQLICAQCCMHYQSIPHTIRGREGHWDPWMHGILSSRARAKSSLFSLLPLPANQKSSPLLFKHCLGRTLIRYKLTEPTASTYSGNAASVHDAPVPGISALTKLGSEKDQTPLR